jgi:FRG domain-containing protein
MAVDRADVDEIEVSTWAQFVTLVQASFSAPCWLYRGQSDSSWRLQSSFERAYQSVGREHWAAIEGYTTSAFRRRLHLFDSHLPAEDDALEWLALMQHHGAPTRLLDWTRSPYVAAYFALDGDFAAKPAIWLIDVLILQNDLYELDESLLPALSKGQRTGSSEVFGPHIMTAGRRALYPVTPFRQNARVAAQQGVFLVGGDLAAGFEANLSAHYRNGAQWRPQFKKVVMNFSSNERLLAMTSRATQTFTHRASSQGWTVMHAP